MRQWLLAVVLLALCSCTSFVGGLPKGFSPALPPTAELHGDTAFLPEERVSIQTAAETWSKQTSGLASITVVWDANFESEENLKGHILAKHHIMVRMTSDMEAIRDMDEESGLNVLGFVSLGGGIHNPWKKPLVVAFIVDRAVPGRALELVTLHEFGHVLGLPHINTRGAVMYPSAFPTAEACLKAADLASFCSVNQCGNHTMFPCE